MRARICLFLNRLGAQRVSSRHVHEKAKHAVAHLHETIPPPQNRLISEEYKITGGRGGYLGLYCVLKTHANCYLLGGLHN